MIVQLTQKELDVLNKIVNHVATETKPYFTTNLNNLTVTSLKDKGLVNTRVNGIIVEAVALDLGKQVIANEVEHEVVLEKTVALEQEPETETGKVESNFVIEDNVPIPDTVYTRKPRPLIYPLNKLEVGQSFFIPANSSTDDMALYRRRITVRISQMKNKIGLDYKFKTAADFENNGVRVWRIA